MNHLEMIITAAKNSEANTLASWNAFVREMKLPSDLYPAMQTGRMELLALVKARAMTEAEVKLLLDMISNLIQTNYCLQKHAEQLAIMVNGWAGAFTHLRSMGEKVQDFANFRMREPEEPDES